MLVIGTAGHIDHGKSAIVKRLTGTDPDRLPEEKERGMTIDLGFAFRQTQSGERMAFVDVPGHERFVRNMIAGAGGIDAVMLVIAADDGWMPQSQEHFQIVRLLGIERGLIIINKIDLVDSEWLELLEEDIHEKVAGSFLADAPMFRVSAHTGQGIDALSNYLDSLPGRLASRRDVRAARLYVDRSFVLPGIGGVVTGTLRDGSLRVGQPVAVWTAGVTGKVRSLHANDREVDQALPGQRTAVSLTGIDKELLVRGSVISGRLDLSFFTANPVLALAVEMLPEAPVTLEDRRRVLLITGTIEVEGELRLPGKNKIRPSQQGLVFFMPEQPVYALAGDHYVLRLPTPMVTLGGGRILDHLAHVPRRKQRARYDYLADRLSWRIKNLVVSELKKRLIARPEELLNEAAVTPAEVAATVKKLIDEGCLDIIGEHVFHCDSFRKAIDGFRAGIVKSLETNPHLRGLPREQVLALSEHDDATTEVMIEYLLSDGAIVKAGDKYDLAGRGMSLKGNIKTAHDRIMNLLREQPLTPPRLSLLAEGGKNSREAIKYIIESGEGYKCGAEFIFLSESWSEIVRFIRDHISLSGKLTVADLKERFGMSRKYAIPILEETDQLKLTRRDGDVRTKGERFESDEFTA
ncbi:MAG: selenocysteine-specific translation elongation factor [candidate division Zixibacteria bacterium]|nr:selenocysteine-specific translation elongation factor [candidate division Zixibacteria bacterium]